MVRKKNYDFQKLLFSVDELIILNVDRNKKDTQKLSTCIKEISKECFIPVTAGGGISPKKILSKQTLFFDLVQIKSYLIQVY